MTRCLARKRERTFFLLKKPRNVTFSRSLCGNERMEPGERNRRTTLCTALGWAVEGRVGKHTILNHTCGRQEFQLSHSLAIWASVSLAEPRSCPGSSDSTGLSC